MLSNQHLKVEGKRRVTLIKFDLQGLPPNILDAQLRLTGGADPGSGTLRVFRGSHSDWTGTTLKKESAPTPGELLAKQSVNVGRGDSVTMPVTPLITGDGTYTLIVTLDEGDNDIWFGATGSGAGPELLITFEDPDGRYAAFGQAAETDSASSKRATQVAENPARPKVVIPPFEYTYDVTKAKKVHKQSDGIVVVEAEDFDAVDHQDHRTWCLTTVDKTPDVKPDHDPNHADGAVGGAYLEILPDTRVTHADPLVNGVSFAPVGGQCSVLYYPIVFAETGRYYVWVRMCCTGSEDNGLHVGIDGEWPESGTGFSSPASTASGSGIRVSELSGFTCGELGQIWLDIEEPGLHTIMFSMREDGFEFDRFLLTKEKNAMESKNLEPGPPASPTR